MLTFARHRERPRDVGRGHHPLPPEPVREGFRRSLFRQAAEHTVVATQVPHYRLEAYALRISSGSTALAYSGDSAPGDALVESARDADLFVCEAMLLRDELDREPRGHLSLEEALDA